MVAETAEFGCVWLCLSRCLTAQYEPTLEAERWEQISD